MNGRMANGALLVLDPSLIMERWDGGVFRKLLGDARVALDAKLTDRCSLKHFRICRAVRYVAHGAAFEFERCMFVNKRPLLICMTSDTRNVRTDSQFSLLVFEAAVRIMAIAALHRALEHFVMEGLLETRLGLVVATHAKLWFALLQLPCVGLIWTLLGRRADERDRPGLHIFASRSVCSMTVSATDIVSPVLAAPEFVMAFAPCMTSKTGFRHGLRVLTFK